VLQAPFSEFCLRLAIILVVSTLAHMEGGILNAAVALAANWAKDWRFSSWFELAAGTLETPRFKTKS
jgi:hypothetical protein